MEQEEGRVKATVVEIQYHGHDALVRIAVESPGTPGFLARVPGDLALSQGQSVWVTLRGHGRVWNRPVNAPGQYPDASPSRARGSRSHEII